jgi:sarcosine oxidase subunit alpha
MHDPITVMVDGSPVLVPSGATVAVAIALTGRACRTSVTGEPRGPLCGMGICFECRVTIDGTPHRRACQVLAEAGMDVRTEE